MVPKFGITVNIWSKMVIRYGNGVSIRDNIFNIRTNILLSYTTIWST